MTSLLDRDHYTNNLLDRTDELLRRMADLERQAATGDMTVTVVEIWQPAEVQLGSDTAASATSCSLEGLPDGPAVDLGWFVFDPYTIQCEIRKWTGGTATAPTFSALTYAHDEGDPVLWVTEPIANVKWFGATGDGSTDDGDAIQAAIDTLDTSEGGTVYLPAGTYVFTEAIEILNRHNLRFVGAGQDVTILDCSATLDVARRDYAGAQAADGCIIVASDVNNTPITNILLRDFTLECSTNGSVSANQKAIFVGATQGCTTERITVDGNGPSSECIYHQDDFGKYSKDWTVQDCEIINPGLAGINSNDTQLEGFRWVRNYIHDSTTASGITGFGCQGGAGGLIADNVIMDIDGAAGIYITHEGGANTYIMNTIIRHNILLGLGSGETDHARYGIRAETVSNGTALDSAILVQGNLIVNMRESTGYTCRGITAAGLVTVKDNIIRDCVNSSNAIAIGIPVPALSGTGTPIIDGNRIERCSSGQEWLRGINISNNAATDGTTVINNYVDEDSILSGGYAFYDYRGYSAHRNNVFNYEFLINNKSFNGSGNLNDSLIVPEMLYCPVLGYQDATPSVRGFGVAKTYGAPYTLTDLDDGVAGQTFTLIFDGPLTVDFTGTNLKGNNGVDYAGSTNDAMMCVYDGTYWHCTIMPTSWPPILTVSESESLGLSDTPTVSVV